jgi:hypothetical protein
MSRRWFRAFTAMLNFIWLVLALHIRLYEPIFDSWPMQVVAVIAIAAPLTAIAILLTKGRKE